jgi:hypothetical protein
MKEADSEQARTGSSRQPQRRSVGRAVQSGLHRQIKTDVAYLENLAERLSDQTGLPLDLRAPSPSGVARARRWSRWPSGRGPGLHCGAPARSAGAGGAGRRTRSGHLEAGSATGSVPDLDPRSSSRGPCIRRLAPGCRRSMSGVHRQPPRPQLADLRPRSRSVRRMARSNTLDTTSIAPPTARPAGRLQWPRQGALCLALQLRFMPAHVAPCPDDGDNSKG